MTEVYLTSDEYIMYLRKSRADNPHESVEEVLAKHETILQEYAVRELGGRIPERCIFREVVSGETISERPRMLEVLSRIESPDVKAVLVVEPQRLSRGDLEDCGRCVNAFRYSSTEVITPTMPYDLTNKMQRKFFEQELMRGNDYLEYTKEILLRGRIASVKRGCYIGNTPPFGYNKIVNEDGDCTLEPNENADYVALAFEMYVNQGKTYLEIARHFDSLGIKPLEAQKWHKTSIRAILKNKHYIGLVYFGEYKAEKTVVSGQVVTQHKKQPTEEVIIAKGKHPAIVSDELFEVAQERMKKNPRIRWERELVNPLASMLVCHRCGNSLAFQKYKHTLPRYACRNESKCATRSIYAHEVLNAVAYALEMEELPKIEAKLNNNEGNSAAIQKKRLDALNKELDELVMREETQYEMLENKTYTPEVFAKRNKALHIQMEALKAKIYEARQNIPKNINYGDVIIKLQDAIEALKDETITPEAKNKLLRAIVDKVEYEFIERVTRGKVRFKLHVHLNI